MSDDIGLGQLRQFRRIRCEVFGRQQFVEWLIGYVAVGEDCGASTRFREIKQQPCGLNIPHQTLPPVAIWAGTVLSSSASASISFRVRHSVTATNSPSERSVCPGNANRRSAGPIEKPF